MKKWHNCLIIIENIVPAFLYETKKQCAAILRYTVVRAVQWSGRKKRIQKVFRVHHRTLKQGRHIDYLPYFPVNPTDGEDVLVRGEKHGGLLDPNSHTTWKSSSTYTGRGRRCLVSHSSHHIVWFIFAFQWCITTPTGKVFCVNCWRNQTSHQLGLHRHQLA